jgi:VWFA-related protein
MRKGTFFISVLIAVLYLSGQEIQEKATAINIEVPVRVYDGKTFVENLSIEDFILYEDGKRQKIDAVYLIKERSIKRKESTEKEEVIREEETDEEFAQKELRHFFLIFDILDYMPKLKVTIEYFFQNIMQPEDTLKVVTPLNNYKLNKDSFKMKSKEEIADTLISLIKKDVRKGNLEYRAIIEELKRVARSIAIAISPAGSSEEKGLMEWGVVKSFESSDESNLPYLLSFYRSYLIQLEKLRGINQKALIDFGKSLKNMDGQKHVFLLYQREFIPQVNPKVLSHYMTEIQNDPTSQMTIESLMTLYKRDITLDTDLVKQAYSDPSVSAHLMFVTKSAEQEYAIRMQEHSEDVFGAFRELALATGGKVESSSDPEYLFRQAAEASENYYLLYYTPKNYVADGRFKEIKVKVKDKKYKVTHRAGYIAD